MTGPAALSKASGKALATSTCTTAVLLSDRGKQILRFSLTIQATWHRFSVASQPAAGRTAPTVPNRDVGYKTN